MSYLLLFYLGVCWYLCNTGNKYSEVDRILTSLKQSCLLVDGSEDSKKVSQMLEIYCVEMQLCSLTHNVGRMKTIYPKTQVVNAAVADPRVLSVIREEGGKMRMAEGHWLEAYNELFEAFRNYQEAGMIMSMRESCIVCNWNYYCCGCCDCCCCGRCCCCCCCCCCCE